MADEVIALRAGSTSEAPKAQPVTDTAPLKLGSPAAISKASHAQVSQAAAEDLHLQADAAIPAGSQLAESLALVSGDDMAAGQKDGTAAAVGSTAADLQVGSATHQQDPLADSSTAEGAEGQVAPEATGSSAAAAAGRMPPRGLTVLRSNPRFASKPINTAVDAESTVVSGGGGGSAGSLLSSLLHPDTVMWWQHVTPRATAALHDGLHVQQVHAGQMLKLVCLHAAC